MLDAARRVDSESDDDYAGLSVLLAPGSSLGGARPKASVRERDGSLALAKFPRESDEWEVPRWEAVALSLAVRAGVAAAESRIEKPGGLGVLILHGFDRDSGRRIPFVSAMTMLAAADHEQRTYTDIAEAIRRRGADPLGDLAELWRRIVFTVLISNSDDHRRNHGFLRAPGGWRLSPAYDLNGSREFAGGDDSRGVRGGGIVGGLGRGPVSSAPPDAAQGNSVRAVVPSWAGFDGNPFSMGGERRGPPARRRIPRLVPFFSSGSRPPGRNAMGSTTPAPVAARSGADYAQGRVTTMSEREPPVPEAVGPVPPGALPEEPRAAVAEGAPAEEEAPPEEASPGAAEVAPLVEIPAPEALEPEVLREILVGLTDTVRPFVEGGGGVAGAVEWRGEFGALRGEFTTLREETKAELVAFRGEFAVFREETKAEIASLRVDFEALRAETRTETASLRDEVKSLGEAVDALRGEFQSFRLDLEQRNDAFRVGIRTEFKDFRVEMRAEFKDFRTEMRTEFKDFKAEMEAKFEKFTAEMEAKFEKFTAEMEAKFEKFTAEMRAEFRGFKAEMEVKFEKFTAEIKAEIKADFAAFEERMGKQLATVKNWAIGGIIAVSASFLGAALFSIFGR